MKRCLYCGMIPDPTEVVEYLRSQGIEVVLGEPGTEKSEPEIIKLLKDVDAAIVGGAPYTKKVIDSAPRLKVISRVGVGYDKVDVEAASARGIHVTIAPIPELTYTVAEHAFSLILSFSRRIAYLEKRVRDGVWTPSESWRFTKDLYSQKLGLLGLGRIGVEVAKRARCFGMSVIYHDLVRRPEVEGSIGIDYVPFDCLLSESDIISLHVPLNEETRGIIDERAISQMKPGSLLVNTARGALVDERALSQALREGRIAGACLDVLSEEPPRAGHPFYRLRDELPNLILTPHCAVSGPTLRKMAMTAAEEVARVLRGERPKYAVNAPR